MKRLTTPNHNYSDLIDLCIEGIADTQAMKPRIIANKQNLLLDASVYNTKINQGEIYIYTPLIRFHDGVCIRNTKDDYEKLYTQYFVPKAKKTRVIYDAILTSANDTSLFR